MKWLVSTVVWVLSNQQGTPMMIHISRHSCSCRIEWDRFSALGEFRTFMMSPYFFFFPEILDIKVLTEILVGDRNTCVRFEGGRLGRQGRMLQSNKELFVLWNLAFEEIKFPSLHTCAFPSAVKSEKHAGFLWKVMGKYFPALDWGKAVIFNHFHFPQRNKGSH